MKSEIIRIQTPKKVLLNGLYFGAYYPKTIIIHIHGYTSSMFSGQDRLLPLINDDTGIIFFNNRGAETISKVKIIDKRIKGKTKSKRIGGAFEKFTDCVDDIQGVIDFAKTKNPINIFLTGHSTGCQKSIYYLSKLNNQKDISGVVLMAPMSDYADGIKVKGIEDVIKYANKMINDGFGNCLIPFDKYKYAISANRLLSFLNPNSKEEIFCYAQKNKRAKTLNKISIPICVILSQKDEFRDRPMNKIKEWFEKNIKSNYKEFIIIKGADHGYTKKNNLMAEIIQKFIENV